MAKSTVVPLVVVKAPVLLPLPLKLSTPLCTFIVPLLVKGVLMVALPVPADLRTVPAFEKVPGPETVVSVWMSKMAPAPTLTKLPPKETIPLPL